MEEIIGLITLVVVFIFKIIGKKLESASGKPSPTVSPQEVFPELDTQDEEPDWVYTILKEESESEPEVAPEPEVRPVSMPKTAYMPGSVEEVRRQVRQTKQILVEEEKKPHEKIDPKKLIVYSEIMNRKY